MADVHVPKVDSHTSKSFLKLFLAVALISVGVFPGLVGEQWRERVQERASAPHKP